MGSWATKGSKSNAASVQTVLALNAAAASPRRARIFDLTFGSSASPVVDQQWVWQCQRCTTVGTGSSKVPNALDPADTLASTIQATDIYTVDPTLTAAAFVKSVGLNQRATFRWVAAPGKELVIPAATNNGIAVVLSAATTSIGFEADAAYEEL